VDERGQEAGYAADAAGPWRLVIITESGLLRPQEVPALCGDAGKLRAATGWTPSVSTLDDLIARIVEEKTEGIGLA
jgi:GDP-D-mannose dehydratase